MLLVDYVIGAEAEFLNAYSAASRLIGQPPDYGLSMVANNLGAAGELAVVLIVNLLIGGLLTWLFGLIQSFMHQAYGKRPE